MISGHVHVGDEVEVSSFDCVNQGRRGKVYSVSATIGVEFRDGTKLRFSRKSLKLVGSGEENRFLAGWVCFDDGDIGFDENNPATMETLLDALDAVELEEMHVTLFYSEGEFEDAIEKDSRSWHYIIGLKGDKVFFASSKVQIDYEAD